MYTVPKLEDYSPEALDRAVAELITALNSETAALKNEAEWKEFRDRWMARKNGIITQVNDTWLKAASKEWRRDVGQRVNLVRELVTKIVESALAYIQGSKQGSPPSVI